MFPSPSSPTAPARRPHASGLAAVALLVLRLAASAVLAGAGWLTAAHAQSFSPFLEVTGRGAYDQYRDTLLCGAVLQEALADGEPDPSQRILLEKGVIYTEGFARFVLESGNVVDTNGTILTPDSLPADQDRTQADWQAVRAGLDEADEAPAAEIARCLMLFGHDW